MKVKLKLQLIILPMIIIPVIATAYIFVMNTSTSIRTLHTENMNRNLEIIMNHLEQENSIIERLGASNTQFYEKNAQSHSRNFILDLKLDNGVIQIYDGRTMEISNFDNTFSRDYYVSMYDTLVQSIGNSSGPVQSEVDVESGRYSVYYQYFEPWDWVVLIHMDDDIIYQSIKTSILQILLVVAFLVLLIGFFIYILTAKLTSPIDELMVAVESIGKGEFHQNIRIETQDEFKELADAFNIMSVKLQSSFDDMNQMTDELMLMNAELEHRVEDRTKELKETNDELEFSIHQLKATQDDLVESKKIAALGSLVSGISHELNTPIGIGITTASYISLQIQSLIDQYSKGELKRKAFESELLSIKNSSTLILDNLNKASNMVNSFKLIAVDQGREEIREFELVHSIESLVQNVNVLLRKGKHKIEVRYDGAVEMYSYPGAISQVITHFIMNSLEHGFPESMNGEIDIHIVKKGKNVVIEYSDNGVGIGDHLVDRVFEPFYTSKLGKGSSGLGLNIVYNLVTGILRGKVSASTLKKGMKFTVVLPTIVKGDD